MGLSSISPWSLLLILLIVVLIFGTKKLKGMGKDLGQAYKGFKDEVEGKSTEKNTENQENANGE